MLEYFKWNHFWVLIRKVYWALQYIYLRFYSPFSLYSHGQIPSNSTFNTVTSSIFPLKFTLIQFSFIGQNGELSYLFRFDHIVSSAIQWVHFVLLNLKFYTSEKRFGDFFSYSTQENEAIVALLYSRLICTSYKILK